MTMRRPVVCAQAAYEPFHNEIQQSSRNYAEPTLMHSASVGSSGGTGTPTTVGELLC
ncbi:hypothetical protein GALL_300980 [mine drainage metagenome]|uniref:Uncharacterized protein n=1 Tax=mine drainage metagenome TaxID=410659 RepID=A0A1J5QWE9_9ZZZZ